MTRIATWVVGVAGLALVAAVGQSYRGVDAVALWLVAVVCLGLTLGLVELDRVATRLDALARELAVFVPRANEGLPAAPPTLRTLFEAGLQRRHASWPQPSFAPYLVGLLVMLGLVGTFLGLVQTLGGARAALATTTDIDAMRAALLTPLGGLSRAFGTSLAGVAGSAALGLAAVVGARRQRVLQREVDGWVTGPLAAQAPELRQLAALEALAQGSQALPRAAEALQQAVERMTSLEQAVTRGNQEQLAQQRARLEALDGELRQRHDAQLQAQARAVEQAGAALAARLQTQGEAQAAALREVGAHLREDQGALLATWQRGHEELATTLRRGQDTLSSTLCQSQETLAARLVKSQETLVSHLRAEQGALATSLHRDLEQLVGTLQQEQAAQLADSRAALHAEVEQLLGQIRTDAAAHGEALARAVAVQTALVDELGRVRRVLQDEVTGTWRAGTQALGQQLAAGVARLQDDLRQALAPLGETLGQGAAAAIAEQLQQTRTLLDEAQARRERAADAAETARLQALDARLDDWLARGATQVQDLVLAQQGALDEVTRALAARLAGVVDAEQQRGRALQESTGQALALLGEQLAHLAAGWQAHLDAATAGVAARLQQVGEAEATRVQQLEAGLGDARQALRQWHQEAAAQAALLQRQVEALSAGLERVEAQAAARAGALQQTFDATRVALEAATRGQGEAVAALTARSLELGEQAQARADERLARLADEVAAAVTRQHQATAELEQRLAQARADDQARLIEALHGAFASQQRELDGVAALLHDVVQLLGVGGGELTLAAELLVRAVDRYREGGELWLEQLARLDGTLRELGHGSVDQLAEYLDQTREAVDHSLQFQQELFAELQSLRGEVRA